MRLVIVTIAASAIILLARGSAYPWGAEGHEAVCEIAYRELTGIVKKKVDAIMLVKRVLPLKPSARAAAGPITWVFSKTPAGRTTTSTSPVLDLYLLSLLA